MEHHHCKINFNPDLCGLKSNQPMGTSNFHYRSTTKCYAVLMNAEDFQYEYECLRDNLKDEFKNKFGQSVSWHWRSPRTYMNPPDVDYLRSYPAQSIVSVRTSLQLDDENKYEDETYADFEFVCIVRSGYYEGACLDYDVKLTVDGFETDVDLIKNEQWRKEIECEIETVGMKIESIFERFSTPLRRVATFSNGETIYEKY